MNDDEKKMRRWIRKELICCAGIRELHQSMNVAGYGTVEQIDAAHKALDQYYKMKDLK